MLTVVEIFIYIFFLITPGHGETDSNHTQRYAYMTVKHPTRWIAACVNQGHGIEPNEEKLLNRKERIQVTITCFLFLFHITLHSPLPFPPLPLLLTCYKEFLLMGLRTIYGISGSSFSRVTNGATMKDTLVWPEVERMVQAGLLEYKSASEENLRPTRKGLALLDYVVRAIY